MHSMPRLLALLAALLFLAPAARALESAPVTSPRATVTIISDHDQVTPGQAFRLALRQRLAPGWHTYWVNPGDAGQPPEVTLDLPGTLPHCAVDAEKLQQALTNLLSNAYKYSPGGGEIRLDTRTSADGRKIGIRITDAGLGMTPAQVARCFERFYRADASGRIPGTGLGLPLVKEIVELLGGRVEIVSTAGEGTSATIWLNVAQPEDRQG